MKAQIYPAPQLSSLLGPVGSGGSKVVNSDREYTLVTETQLTVGVAPVVIAVPAAGSTYTFLVINRSGGGQILRTGFAPAFAAPNVGVSVLVNEVVIYENINFALSIVSNVAGALADVTVLAQSLI